MQARAADVAAAILALDIGHIHPVGQGMEQRDFDAAPFAGAASRIEGLQNRLMRCHAGGDIANRHTDPAGLFGGAGNLGQPNLGLYQKIIGFHLLKRAV